MAYKELEEVAAEMPWFGTWQRLRSIDGAPEMFVVIRPGQALTLRLGEEAASAQNPVDLISDLFAGMGDDAQPDPAKLVEGLQSKLSGGREVILTLRTYADDGGSELEGRGDSAGSAMRQLGQHYQSASAGMGAIKKAIERAAAKAAA